jgi:hypothetical protein
MSDKPKIEVGQRWLTNRAGIVRVLATDGVTYACPVIVEDQNGNIQVLAANGSEIVDDNGEERWGDYHLISLAPQTVKREVALYRCDDQILVYEFIDWVDNRPTEYRISEPVIIEFTLLPGECAE